MALIALIALIAVMVVMVEADAEVVVVAPSRAINDSLWHEIQAFPLDNVGDTLPFSQRLARENRWPLWFAFHVIGEYRRFLYLLCRAGHPVTPSVEVDQAWHLHMLYTRSYWQDLAPILPIEPHHGPTKGGVEENRKFRGWYQHTLDSYERFFGHVAPSNVWPSPEHRFSPKQRMIYLDASKVYIAQKKHLHGAAVGLILAGITALAWSWTV